MQEANANIEYSCSFVGSRPNEADIAIRVQDNETAEKAIADKGIKIITL